MANRVGVARTRYYLDELSSPEIPDRPAVDFRASAVRHVADPPWRQAWLFASLTLRAARNYVRYSAALRSYSGFVEMPRSEKLSTLFLFNERSS